MTPVETAYIVGLQGRIAAAAHGGKSALVADAAMALGKSKGTIHRMLAEVRPTRARKQRADSGSTALSEREAQIIAGLLMEATRRNGKRLYSVEDALEALRANDLVKAEKIDLDGVVTELSVSTIRRALKLYGLHPDQLLQPAPVTELRSLHPNHVWQIDASLCVLYYLKPQADPRANGLRVMDHKEFNKNKPKNLARVMADRVWSYEISEHTSDWIYVEYVMGAESGENLCNVLINAMQDRGGADVLHGVPKILMMDPGSAGQGQMAKNLCAALGIEMIAHAAGNARVTGQVENARNIIERKLEPGLKFHPVNSLAELNELASKWRAHFNATARHSRHGLTRTECWMKIRQDQLQQAPSIDICRELATAAPAERLVKPKLRVEFQGMEWDVSTVPGLIIGQKVLVTRNPWRSDCAQVVQIGEHGREVFHLVARVETDEYGFATSAATIGQEFRRAADTPAQTAAKGIELLVTGTATAAEAEAFRKAKGLPFAGFDPYKHIDDATLPTYLPRRGTASDVVSPVVEFAPQTLSLTKAMFMISESLGRHLTPQENAFLSARFAGGVPDEQVQRLIEQFSGAGLVPTAQAMSG